VKKRGREVTAGDVTTGQLLLGEQSGPSSTFLFLFLPLLPRDKKVYLSPGSAPR